MTEKKKSPTAQSNDGIDAPKAARHGLRLVRSQPEDESETILQEIMGATFKNHPAQRSAESIARAKSNPLVRQLTNLADAIDAEIVMIMKM